MQQSVRLGIIEVNYDFSGEFWIESEVGYGIGNFDGCG